MKLLTGWIAFSWIFLWGGMTTAAETRVTTAVEARKAVRTAKPGDTIVLAAGKWENAHLQLEGEGTAEQPIHIRAEWPGKTILTGTSRVRISGSHLVISGLYLLNLSKAKTDWLEFRVDSTNFATHCRVTNCALVETEDFPKSERNNRWVGIYGSNNQVDHCHFSGKKNVGATMIVALGEGNEGKHHIHKNWFGYRPPLGENGGESIRVGTSGTSMQQANCLIEDNAFYACDGEVECISNKSCGNIYRGNYFIKSAGTLTLRHGNDCLVEGNVFIGQGKKNSGGVRINGQGHRVIGNFFIDLKGKGPRSAISFLNGIPDGPEYGYHQIVGAEVRDNFISNCRESVLIGYASREDMTQPAKGIRFAGNHIIAAPKQAAIRVLTPPLDIHWEGNRIEGELVNLEEKSGMRDAEIDLAPSTTTPNFRKKIGPSWDKELRRR